ncbi:MAG: hypothetical protein JEZ06_01490 [Anaerolineaceae bacterium]|nr:hypothetical protein [Anaerolineaceae bacterium]
MKNIITAFWKIVVLTIVFFVINSVMGVILPLSNDMMAAMSSSDQAIFSPLFLLNVFINMTVMYLMLIHMRFRSWKLWLIVWLAFFGLFNFMNAVELYWYNEAFPLFTYLDVTKLILIALIAYGVSTLVGTWLVKGFKPEELARQTSFDVGRFGWKVLLFCVAYSLFYYCCGFIPWMIPEVREFYANWALTMEPIPVLLLFNVFRGALWLVFSLPVLMGARNRKSAYWLMPLVLFAGTAGATIIPSAVMPGIVRLGHFIELGFSMSVVGVFMVWLFLKEQQQKEMR